MAEQPQAEGGASPKHETLMEKLADKLHVGGKDSSSSSSDSDNDERPRPSAPPAPAAEVKPSFSDSAATAAAEAKAKVFRLFGREQPIHKALGGGKRMALFHALSDAAFLYGFDSKSVDRIWLRGISTGLRLRARSGRLRFLGWK